MITIGPARIVHSDTLPASLTIHNFQFDNDVLSRGVDAPKWASRTEQERKYISENRLTIFGTKWNELLGTVNQHWAHGAMRYLTEQR